VQGGSGLELGFFGGAGTVTGSRHLLTVSGRRLLIDCGLFQGLKQLRLLNWEAPPFDPDSIDAAILTHTHIDHCGAFPRLVRQGYKGSIFCSPPTRDAAPVLLMDAAKLQEEDAAYANRKGFSKHRPALPLFTAEDVQRTLRRLHATPYGERFEACRGVEAVLHDAGHILGSAFVEVLTRAGPGEMRLVFSGDIGRYAAPLHRDPESLPACDVLVIESTYGDRSHDDTPLVDQLCAPLCEALERGGTVLIPAFAMARVQVLTVALRRLMESGELPTVPVHIDSPMAVELTELYRTYAGSGRWMTTCRRKNGHACSRLRNGASRMGPSRLACGGNTAATEETGIVTDSPKTSGRRCFRRRCTSTARSRSHAASTAWAAAGSSSRPAGC
jgi:metallo-beta-lactamase family protein